VKNDRTTGVAADGTICGDAVHQELEEAKELGEVERAEQAEQKIDPLTWELSRAVGLGRRNRRAASASERARRQRYLVLHFHNYGDVFQGDQAAGRRG